MGTLVKDTDWGYYLLGTLSVGDTLGLGPLSVGHTIGWAHYRLGILSAWPT